MGVNRRSGERAAQMGRVEGGLTDQVAQDAYVGGPFIT